MLFATLLALSPSRSNPSRSAAGFGLVRPNRGLKGGQAEGLRGWRLRFEGAGCLRGWMAGSWAAASSDDSEKDVAPVSAELSNDSASVSPATVLALVLGQSWHGAGDLARLRWCSATRGSN